MATLDRIIGTYRSPAATWEAMFDEGTREDRALAHLIGGCVLAFLSFLPFLAREAHLTGADLNMLLGGALFGWMFIAPLLAYVLSLIIYIPLKFIMNLSGAQVRRILFWSFFAATPLLLIFGLIRGLLGEGSASSAVGVLWLMAVIWGLSTGIRAGGRYAKHELA